MRRHRPIHPLPLRIMHWLNVIAIVTLIGSGWEIYNASPILPFSFPQWAIIGEWLGGAIAWHFAAIWLLMVNGLAYLGWGTLSGHFRRKLLPLSLPAITGDLVAALRFRLHHEEGVYNGVQRLFYWGAIVLLILAVLSGLAVWKPVQLWYLSDLFGGFAFSRIVHFAVMSAICAFILIHVLLVALVPRVLPAMIFGGRLNDTPPAE